MTVTVNITADSADEARAEMRNLLAEKFTPAAQVDTGPAPTIQPPAEKPKRAPRGGVKVTDAVDQNTAQPEPTQAIQTGGDREPPAEEPKPKLLTLDDVRAAATPYINKFTMAAASNDLTPCLEQATGCKAISELADKDQATLQKAIDAFTAAGKADTRYGAEAPAAVLA